MAQNDRILVPSSQEVLLGSSGLDAVDTRSIKRGFSWVPQDSPQERGRQLAEAKELLGAALLVERRKSQSRRLIASRALTHTCTLMHLAVLQAGLAGADIGAPGGSAQGHQASYPPARLSSHLGEQEPWESDAKPGKGSEPGFNTGNSSGCNRFDQTQVRVCRTLQKTTETQPETVSPANTALC